MKCNKCNKEFPERLIDESHDISCYLFFGDKRNIKKNQADKYPRRWLCKECHNEYEKILNEYLIEQSIKFSKEYFKDG